MLYFSYPVGSVHKVVYYVNFERRTKGNYGCRSYLDFLQSMYNKRVMVTELPERPPKRADKTIVDYLKRMS